MLISRAAAGNLILVSASGFSSHRVSVGDLPRDIYIAQKMNKWLQKGEFEKTSDWEKHIKQRGQPTTAVCQNGGLISSEILRKFTAVWLVPAVVEAVTSASCKNVSRYLGRASIELENILNKVI